MSYDLDIPPPHPILIPLTPTTLSYNTTLTILTILTYTPTLTILFYTVNLHLYIALTLISPEREPQSLQITINSQLSHTELQLDVPHSPSNH